MKFKKLKKLKDLISCHTHSINKIVISKRAYRDRRNVEPIKKYFNYRCQYCGYRLKTTSGKYMCHFAHIVPHKISRDNTLENVFILCPTHHAEFDYNKKRRKEIFNTIKEKFPHINYPNFKDI